jgi:YesN/AraC family two-component response regulator
LNWLLYLIIGMTCILVIILLGGNDNIIYSSVTGLILYIGYFGIKQVGVFNESIKIEQSFDSKEDVIINSPFHRQPLITSAPYEETDTTETMPPIQKVKYEKTKISDSETNSIHQRLKELMNTEKLYKNPELTLSEVAKRIPIHQNTLSQVINTVEEKSFYDYINFQRVEEFQRIALLPKSNQYTLLSLAFESGFNSKTSFNRNFKKITNLSPSEFLKQKNIQLQE